MSLNRITLNISYFSYYLYTCVMERCHMSLLCRTHQSEKRYSDVQLLQCSLTKESLFWYRREPLLHKSGESDFFCLKKFAMSLFCAIFAVENGREAATLGFVFTECLRSAFALASLPEAKKGGRKEGGIENWELRIENYPGTAAIFQLSTFNFQLSIFNSL